MSIYISIYYIILIIRLEIFALLIYVRYSLKDIKSFEYNNHNILFNITQV